VRIQIWIRMLRERGREEEGGTREGRRSQGGMMMMWCHLDGKVAVLSRDHRAKVEQGLAHVGPSVPEAPPILLQRQHLMTGCSREGGQSLYKGSRSYRVMSGQYLGATKGLIRLRIHMSWLLTPSHVRPVKYTNAKGPFRMCVGN
jgi:hypothetical protein